MRRLLALLLAGLAGCVAAPGAVEPVIDLGERRCDAAPVLQGALPLPARTGTALDGRDGPVTFDFDLGAPCIRQAGERAGLYAPFRLPDGHGEVMLTVRSVPLGRTLLAPRVRLLDASGKEVRRVEADGFLFRGQGLTALVRLRPEEVFVVVGSSPVMAGQGFDRLQTDVRTQVIPIGVGVVMMPVGSEATRQMMFSHNGRVVLETRPMDSATVGR